MIRILRCVLLLLFCLNAFGQDCTTAPNAVSVYAVTQYGATFEWGSQGAELWDIHIAPVSDPMPDASTQPTYEAVDQNPYSVDILQPGQNYRVCVRNNCTPEDSEWTCSYFTTQSYCAAPFAVAATVTGTTSATVNWTAGSSETQWQLYVVPQGTGSPSFDAPLDATAPYYLADSKPYALSGLQPSTVYLVYVRAVCSPTSVSYWPVQSGNFTTGAPNDNCLAAPLLEVSTGLSCDFPVSGSTVGATASSQPSTCNGQEDDDVWYQFVAPSTTVVGSITTDSQYPVNAILSTGSCEAGFSELSCYASTASMVFSNLIVGNTYHIRVYTGAGASIRANFTICLRAAQPVSNDEPSTAIGVSANLTAECAAVVQGNSFGATGSTGISNSCAGSEEDDVWYSFVPNLPLAGLSVTALAQNSLSFAVYYKNEDGNLVLIGCHASGTYLLDGLMPGQIHYIRVWATASTPVDNPFEICLRKAPVPIATATGMSAQDLVNDILINNPCVVVSNITSSSGTTFGESASLGYFHSPFGQADFPMASGIVLSTGKVDSIVGPNDSVLSDGTINWPGDDQLEDIILAGTGFTMVSHNATKLEFDFTSPNAFMSFNFLFASEEYGTYQCEFADAFAFILTDLTTGTSTNLAVVPGTDDPVSVITVRDDQYNDACSSVNPAYFANYYEEGDLFSGINYNGRTQVMTASSPIVPGNAYHIKLVVADRLDQAFDTSVFIQAGSFTAGPPSCLDRIELVSFVDLNANGTKDTNEPVFNQGHFTMQQNNTGEVTNISTPLGIYDIFDDNPSNVYDFGYVIDAEFQPYFALTPVNFDNVNIPQGSGTQLLYFPIVVAEPFNDVTVTLTSLGAPRAGAEYDILLTYRNLGMSATAGTITYTKDPAVSLLSISEPGAVTNATGFSFNFTGLQPLESRSMVLTHVVPNIPAVNIGDALAFSAAVTAPSGDINMANNAFDLNEVVVAAYDPNDKMEAHGGKIMASQFTSEDFLYYTIRFQNEGTADALAVRIEDVLDAQLDPSSLRMIGASHNYVLERVGNLLTWRFDYIMLPGKFQDEEASKGYVTFAIKPFAGYAVGDVIPNAADIYFDTNPAIVTNTFNVEFTAAMGVSDISDRDFSVYPNPASDTVTVLLQHNGQLLESVTIYDVVGKKVASKADLQATQAKLPIHHLSKGIYMMEITTDGQFKAVRKLVVE